ncbi:MAG: ferrous iron transport protein A [Psychromonas sp.]|nr:ferrous iron transport protein A [Psychromonas sp.]
MNQGILKIQADLAVTENMCMNKNALSNLSEAEINKEYIIKDVITDDQNIVNFLFTLGCFKGEPITVISLLCENYIITVKDARYSIDADLAKAITLI